MTLVDKYIEDTFNPEAFNIEKDTSLSLIMTNAKRLTDRNGGQLIIGQALLDEAVLIAYDGNKIEECRFNEKLKRWTRVVKK